MRQNGKQIYNTKQKAAADPEIRNTGAHTRISGKKKSRGALAGGDGDS